MWKIANINNFLIYHYLTNITLNAQNTVSLQFILLVKNVLSSLFFFSVKDLLNNKIVGHLVFVQT